ncbi:unnamed protein product [Haemonchus placei]|uniref:ELM2 domain-containing protein n=1 Tax=Haemonchus placei TaxID=6290 RepID=A0A0N4VSK3_HAEPC|nr:unnamed protein product [Haemonchus placei]
MLADSTPLTTAPSVHSAYVNGNWSPKLLPRERSVVSGATQDFNVENISEDVAIEAEEVDEEPFGGIAVTLLDESLDEVPRIPRRPTKGVENHLSDVSDEEVDRLPPARYRSEIEELVDCNCFKWIEASSLSQKEWGSLFMSSVAKRELDKKFEAYFV